MVRQRGGFCARCLRVGCLGVKWQMHIASIKCFHLSAEPTDWNTMCHSAHFTLTRKHPLILTLAHTHNHPHTNNRDELKINKKYRITHFARFVFGFILLFPFFSFFVLCRFRFWRPRWRMIDFGWEAHRPAGWQAGTKRCITKGAASRHKLQSQRWHVATRSSCHRIATRIASQQIQFNKRLHGLPQFCVCPPVHTLSKSSFGMRLCPASPCLYAMHDYMRHISWSRSPPLPGSIANPSQPNNFCGRRGCLVGLFVLCLSVLHEQKVIWQFPWKKW